MHASNANPPISVGAMGISSASEAIAVATATRCGAPLSEDLLIDACRQGTRNAEYDLDSSAK